MTSLRAFCVLSRRNALSLRARSMAIMILVCCLSLTGCGGGQFAYPVSVADSRFRPERDSIKSFGDGR
jgi:hypothetical protein